MRAAEYAVMLFVYFHLYCSFPPYFFFFFFLDQISEDAFLKSEAAFEAGLKYSAAY